MGTAIEKVLSVQNVSKSFSSDGQSVKALDSISFDIPKGEVFGLLGPNGAGKTTLISILCGFLTPDKGKATLFGMDCTHESRQIKKRMNFVSGFSGVSEFFNAEELLTFYCMLYNIENPKERIVKALKATDIYEHRKRRPSCFSSGLKRRFLISKSLLNDPEMLLLDEPTVGLDVESASALRLLVKEMKQKGNTLLLTTHNMREAEELCDRIALIRKGRIIACGKFADLKKQFFPHEVIDVKCTKPDKIENVLSGIKSIVRFKKYSNGTKIYLANDKDIAKIINLISLADVGLLGINTIEPELEDLYTKIMDADNDD